MDVSVRDLEAAQQRIRGVVRRTPLERSAWLSDHAGHDVYLKLECWQRTRSFKLRGAFNAIASLAETERARGLVTASAGNHGQAVALAAREVNARATIFVPANAPATKKNRIRAWGAELRDQAATYDEAEIAAAAFARETGARLVHAFSDFQVVAGQGTVGLEILQELPAVAQVVVPVGGGGLIAGIGAALRSAGRRVVLTGVQSTRTTHMYDAFQAGHLVDSPIPPTLADGLAGCTDQISYERAREVVDDLLLVEEAALAPAIRSLFHNEGIVAEGAGVVAVAALLTRAVSGGGPTVLVVTGGNIDGSLLAGILASE